MVFLLCHSPQEGTLGTFLKGIHCGRCPSSPSGMFGSLPVPWQIGLPPNQVHICCPSGLGRTCILPLSTLALQHGGTSLAILLTSGEFQDPTRGTHPGRALDPLISPTPEQRYPPPQPSLEPPGFSQCIPCSVIPKGLSN